MNAKDLEQYEGLRFEIGDVLVNSLASDKNLQTKLSKWIILGEAKFATDLAQELGKVVLCSIRDDTELLRSSWSLVLESCIAEHDFLGRDQQEAADASYEELKEKYVAPLTKEVDVASLLPVEDSEDLTTKAKLLAVTDKIEQAKKKTPNYELMVQIIQDVFESDVSLEWTISELIDTASCKAIWIRKIIKVLLHRNLIYQSGKVGKAFCYQAVN